jgi:hypothetical protein
MLIDAFKTDFFKNLSVYNQDLIDVFNEVCFYNKTDVPYYRSEPTKEVSYWFDPRRMRDLPLPKHYPRLIPLNNDPKFCLIEFLPSYVSIFLTNLVYQDRKDVLIEDVCCGQSKYAFYLSKLGFKNFNLIDDFSQMKEELLLRTIEKAKLIPSINQSCSPIVFNQTGYGNKVKEVPPSVELMCLFANCINWMEESLEYRLLCHDSDNELIWAYARLDKYDEFAEKLLPYMVIQ